MPWRERPGPRDFINFSRRPSEGRWQRRRRERACGVGVVRHRFRQCHSIGNCVIFPAHRGNYVRLPGIERCDAVVAQDSITSPGGAAWSRPDS